MDPALMFGAAFGGAVLLASAGARVGHGERILARLGAERDRAAGRTVGRLTRRAVRRGWRGGGGSYAAAVVGLATLGGAAGFKVAGPVGAVAGLAGAPLALEAFLSARLAHAGVELERQLGEWVTSLAAATRAGLSLRRALEDSVGDTEAPLRDHLDMALRRLTMGEPLEEVLRRLSSEIGSRDAALLVSLLAVHRRTGGDLGALLDQVARIIVQRSTARRELRALTAQGRASGTVLAVLPIAFVTLLSWTGGDGLGAFYRSPRGALLLGGGLLCEIVGFLWIRRIVRPSEQR